nr:MAG TPA_asm: hypothetical protein [Caudoviricetes sp.]
MKALPSGLLALMSISIKKLASASAVLAVTVWCWRVSAHCRPATNSRMPGASPRSSW